MFDHLIKQMEKLAQEGIRVPISTDKDGYIDRECPAEECVYQFKVFESDWSELFQEDAVYCPFCKHEAGSQSWFTTEQLEDAKAKAVKMLEVKIHNSLFDDSRRFNRSKKRNSFVSMSMNVRGGRKSTILLPTGSLEELERKVQCDKCQTRYAVVGAAFFCPCCGAVRSKGRSIRPLRGCVLELTI